MLDLAELLREVVMASTQVKDWSIPTSSRFFYFPSAYTIMDMASASDKIKTLEEIVKITKEARANGKKVVTTNGAFDLVHVGHIRNLEEAKSLGDLLIVGVNSDKSVKNYKGPARPIVGENDRAEIVAALECVDYVFIFDDPDPRPWLGKIHTDFHVKGGDWKDADKSRAIGAIVEAQLLKEKGAELVLANLVPGKSTSAIIEKIRGSCRRNEKEP